jgi:hypothetical protein
MAQNRILAMFPRVRFTCTLCGECCRRYWIPVTHIDVARIAEFTGMKPRDFLALFPKDMAADWDEPVIKLRDGEYYLVLKKRLDGTCIFNKWVAISSFVQFTQSNPTSVGTTHSFIGSMAVS